MLRQHVAFFVLLLVTGGLLSYPSMAASTIKKIGGIANNDASGDVTKQSMIKLTTTTPSANTLTALYGKEKALEIQ